MKIQRRPSNVLLRCRWSWSASPASMGRPDIVTLAWVGNVCSAPPMLSISLRPSRHSYGLLQRTHEFVVNLPTRSQAARSTCAATSRARHRQVRRLRVSRRVGRARRRSAHRGVPINIECVTRHRLSLARTTCSSARSSPCTSMRSARLARPPADGKVDPLSYVIVSTGRSATSGQLRLHPQRAARRAKG